MSPYNGGGPATGAMTFGFSLFGLIAGAIVLTTAYVGRQWAARTAVTRVSIHTVGTFPTDSAFVLEKGHGWSRNASGFPALHRRPKWYGTDILDQLRAGLKRLDATPGAESYRFGGARQISRNMICPRYNYCAVVATWANQTWSVRRDIFITYRGQIPERIRILLANTTLLESSHFLLLQGPVLGAVVFNPIHLAMPGYSHATGEHCEHAPLLLPNGVPDGIIGISHMSKYYS